MAASASTGSSRLRAALAAAMTVLILVPAGVLFAWVWSDNHDSRDSSTLEQQGVDYLASLPSLISGLVEAQSSALQGVSSTPASLADAVARVSTADQRLGDQLGTHERWSGLRDKIQKLPSVSGSPVDIYTAHVEATDLALGLYNAVRKNSELIRDPDNDISNLQQALAVDLPSTVVEVSRMGDLSQMVAGIAGTPAQRQQSQAVLVPQFGAAVQQVNTDVSNLTDNLQSAVDDTSSVSLSGSLVSTVDSFRRGVEAYTRGADLTGSKPNAGTMATAQSQLQTSSAGLSTVLTAEMNKLLQARLDSLHTRRVEALVTAGVLILLVLLAILLPQLGRRRRRGPIDGERSGPVRTAGPEHGENGYGNGYGSGPLDPPPGYGEANPTRRERSGALR